MIENWEALTDPTNHKALEAGGKQTEIYNESNVSTTKLTLIKIEDIEMREAVIVSAARTPIGKAYRGAFNNLESSMASVAVKAAVDRSGIDPKEVDDCIMGAAIQQGTQVLILGDK